ncbi:hypothetical protein CCACVL1_00590 [Corchorus capsularis]|uniref:Uncharacterized protein n=1 Tax=Corchorus capsularis TaxID=210143 RepID=A0A1R3KW48_COCAP|nr:hypothetical protein CCACVL1_00590 [Corchorus capsularis]
MATRNDNNPAAKREPNSATSSNETQPI